MVIRISSTQYMLSCTEKSMISVFYLVALLHLRNYTRQLPATMMYITSPRYAIYVAVQSYAQSNCPAGSRSGLRPMAGFADFLFPSLPPNEIDCRDLDHNVRHEFPPSQPTPAALRCPGFNGVYPSNLATKSSKVADVSQWSASMVRCGPKERL
ncbi:hypothetical protein BX600DRAFT_466960 [Xylariales sp. PMI_506]|nr:hypothetical protein BX600DRAFT_466960 [Xylariales sp. PMI_506]